MVGQRTVPCPILCRKIERRDRSGHAFAFKKLASSGSVLSAFACAAQLQARQEHARDAERQQHGQTARICTVARGDAAALVVDEAQRDAEMRLRFKHERQVLFDQRTVALREDVNFDAMARRDGYAAPRQVKFRF